MKKENSNSLMDSLFPDAVCIAKSESTQFSSASVSVIQHMHAFMPHNPRTRRKYHKKTKQDSAFFFDHKVFTSDPFDKHGEILTGISA